jgi:hypothetical protein
MGQFFSWYTPTEKKKEKKERKREEREEREEKEKKVQLITHTPGAATGRGD